MSTEQLTNDRPGKPCPDCGVAAIGADVPIPHDPDCPLTLEVIQRVLDDENWFLDNKSERRRYRPVTRAESVEPNARRGHPIASGHYDGLVEVTYDPRSGGISCNYDDCARRVTRS